MTPEVKEFKAQQFGPNAPSLIRLWHSNRQMICELCLSCAAPLSSLNCCQILLRGHNFRVIKLKYYLLVNFSRNDAKLLRKRASRMIKKNAEAEWNHQLCFHRRYLFYIMDRVCSLPARPLILPFASLNFSLLRSTRPKGNESSVWKTVHLSTLLHVFWSIKELKSH